MTKPGARRVHLPELPGSLFPGDGVVVHEYRPAREGPRARAGVVLLPIQGGDYEVSTMLAEYLWRQGYACLRFERRAEWLVADREVDQLPLLFRQYLADIRRGVDWWLEEGTIDPARLGLLGVSMGAHVGSAVAGTDPRFRAAVLIIGGGDLADIVMRAHDEEVNAYRADLARRLGVSIPELRPLFEAALGPHDALHSAPGMDAATTLFLAARFDRVVPWANSVRLWEAIGRPKRVTLPCGHYSTAVFVPYVRWAARRWFDRHLL